MKAVFVFVGGGIGSVLRYAVGLWIGSATFPWATLGVNAVGSLAIGLFGGWAVRLGWSETVRLALIVGLCGGFTTFSTFSKESLALMTAGRYGALAAYAVGSVALGIVMVAAGCFIGQGKQEATMENETVYSFTVKGRGGTTLDLATLKGKMLLIVNTATGCGFTPQYEGLEQLYGKYRDRGLEILDFPCDQFGHQAPGSDDEIHQFCALKYNTSFDQLAKIEVNGAGAEPLYQFLKATRPKDDAPEADIVGLRELLAKHGLTGAEAPGDIEWNFTKFLIDRDGKVIKRFHPTTPPEAIAREIEPLLN